MMDPTPLLFVLLVARGVHPVAAEPNAIVDHHVHVLSPNLVRDWKSLGVPFSRPDSAYTSAAALLGGASEAGGLRQAVLVPMAHLYGSEWFRTGLRLDLREEQARVQAENDHVALEAARYPGKAVAFCSVDFLRPYAWEEIRRCRRALGSRGLKLHLASAGADLRDQTQLDRLREIAGWAESEGVALLLHFDPQRRGLETRDVARFVDQVLAPHPRLEVLLAHLGGSGGYGAWTRSVFGAFAGWLERQTTAGRRPRLYFDVSAVVLERESEGVPATTAEEAALLARDLRRVGLDRVVFGSDHPVFEPRAYARLLAERVGLTADELPRILANRAPVIAPAAADTPVPIPHSARTEARMINLVPTTAAEACVSEPAAKPTLEALPGRPTDLGGLPIRRLLPRSRRRLVGPWCFLDAYGPLTFSSGKPMDVAPHPHVGLQTVSWFLDGEVLHNDSLGLRGTARPGVLNLMTAGLAHAEETPRESTGRLHGFQLWVALPDASRATTPAFEQHGDLPVVPLDGGRATLIIGELGGARSLARAFSPIVGAEVPGDPGRRVAVPLRPELEHARALPPRRATVVDRHALLPP